MAKSFFNFEDLTKDVAVDINKQAKPPPKQKYKPISMDGRDDLPQGQATYEGEISRPVVGSTSQVGKPMPTDVAGITAWLAKQRQGDLTKGKDFASDYFGAGNPAMQEILAQRKERALGLNQAEILAMTERGQAGINAQTGTGLRALRGALNTNGVRGGAAAGMAMPLLMNANQQNAGLQRDIAVADMERRGTELNNYESSLTGERAGELGTIFGYAGLGAGDRSGALQYSLGHDYLKGVTDYLKGLPGSTPEGGIPGPETFGGLPKGLGGGGGKDLATGQKPLVGYEQWIDWLTKQGANSFGKLGDAASKIPSVGNGNNTAGLSIPGFSGIY